jgi:hypothetical protein
MSNRRVVTEAFHTASGQPVDSYLDKLAKYIPGEIVSAWVAINGIWMTADGTKYAFSKRGMLICYFVCLAITALYIWFLTRKPNEKMAIFQILISTGSFGIWAFALQNYFPLHLGAENPPLWSVVLIIYTLVVGLAPPLPKPKELRTEATLGSQANPPSS